jgi:hypothetical protein
MAIRHPGSEAASLLAIVVHFLKKCSHAGYNFGDSNGTVENGSWIRKRNSYGARGYQDARNALYETLNYWVAKKICGSFEDNNIGRAA